MYNSIHKRANSALDTSVADRSILPGTLSLAGRTLSTGRPSFRRDYMLDVLHKSSRVDWFEFPSIDQSC